MKILLVCGDRNWKNKDLVYQEILKRVRDKKFDCIVQGGAKGVDKYGKRAADILGVACFTCHANWDFYKRAAGPIRNGWQIKFMVVTEVLAFHNNIKQSSGTKDMIRQAKKKGIKTTLIKEK